MVSESAEQAFLHEPLQENHSTTTRMLFRVQKEASDFFVVSGPSTRLYRSAGIYKVNRHRQNQTVHASITLESILFTYAGVEAENGKNLKDESSLCACGHA